MGYLLVSLAALGVGVVMGLLGGGGGILTVPILRYLFAHPEKIAITESLIIVALVGVSTVIPGARKGTIWWRGVLLLGCTGQLGAFIGSRLSFLVAGTTQFLVMAVVMIIAALMILRPNRSEGELICNSENSALRHSAPIGLIAGFGTGILTGFLGVGGGFFLVPVLYQVLHLPLAQTIPTSLAILTLNALMGCAVHIPNLYEHGQSIDWVFVAVFACTGQIGAVLGRKLGRTMPSKIVRGIFAGMLVVAALGILIVEI